MKDEGGDFLKILLFATVLIAIMVTSPLVAIWSVNTLFGLAIPFGFSQWLAAGFLMLVVGGQRYQGSK